MSQWTKIFIGVGSLLFVAALILLIMILQADSSACKNTVEKEYISPDNTLKAVVFERNCGGEKFSTQVSIVGSFDSLGTDAGNILILEGRAMQVAPSIKWERSNELVVGRSLDGSEFLAQRRWLGDKEVMVKYQAVKK